MGIHVLRWNQQFNFFRTTPLTPPHNTHIVDKSVDVFVVAIAGPGSVVCAAMEGLDVLQGGATGLGGQGEDQVTTLATVADRET